jgi:hypothetical protein
MGYTLWGTFLQTVQTLATIVAMIALRSFRGQMRRPHLHVDVDLWCIFRSLYQALAL